MLNESVSRLRRRRKTSELEALDQAVSADAGLVSLFPLSLVPLPADTEAARSEMRQAVFRAKTWWTIPVHPARHPHRRRAPPRADNPRTDLPQRNQRSTPRRASI